MNPENDPHANPYAAPKADLDVPDAPAEIPARVLGHIRVAWIAGAISSVFTLGQVLILMRSPFLRDQARWNFVDVALIAGLTFGIYRKSRTCAVLMVMLFLVSRMLLLRSGAVNGWTVLLGLIFLFYYARGVLGTFQYHRLVAARESASGG